MFAGLDDVGLHWPVVLFCLGVGVLTALVFGFLPSVWSVRADPGRYIAGRPGVVGGGRRRLIPRGLVAVELALALVLLTGGGLFINSLIRTSQIYLGFDTADITVLDFILPRRQYADLVPSDSFPQIDYAGEERDHDFPVWRPTGEDYELTARLIRRLEAIPGVESVGSSSYVPGTNNSWGGEFFREGEARCERG